MLGEVFIVRFEGVASYSIVYIYGILAALLYGEVFKRLCKCYSMDGAVSNRSYKGHLIDGAVFSESARRYQEVWE